MPNRNASFLGNEKKIDWLFSLSKYDIFNLNIYNIGVWQDQQTKLLLHNVSKDKLKNIYYNYIKGKVRLEFD